MVRRGFGRHRRRRAISPRCERVVHNRHSPKLGDLRVQAEARREYGNAMGPSLSLQTGADRSYTAPPRPRRLGESICMGGRYVQCIMQIPHTNLHNRVGFWCKKCSGVPHAATPVTLTGANPSRYCGRSLIVAMPDLEGGRVPGRKRRKDNAVRRSFCSFQLINKK